MVVTVEVYKEIRKIQLEGKRQRQIAGVLHISRNTVKKYWDGDQVPWERKNYSREATVLTEDVVAFVQSCLDEDMHSPRKQHHTAKRIYERLATEYIRFCCGIVPVGNITIHQGISHGKMLSYRHL